MTYIMRLFLLTSASWRIPVLKLKVRVLERNDSDGVNPIIQFGILKTDQLIHL